MAKQFCTECGAPLEEGTRFCPECGVKVSTESVSSEQKTAQPQDNKTQTQAYAYTQSANNQNSGAYHTQPNEQYGNYGVKTAPVMSVGSYLLTFFLMSIPIVGIIMFFVWLFDKSSPNRQNLLLAQLIWGLICSAAAIVFLVIFGSAIIGILQNYSFGGNYDFSSTYPYL